MSAPPGGPEAPLETPAGELPLLVETPSGLYCEKGDFYIDPNRKVPRAVVTHGHADHARPGMGAYLACQESEWILRARLGTQISLETLPYGAKKRVGLVDVSFHPAGHILGSAMALVERRGERWLVSGDYKTEAERTATAWQPVKCHVFITETTFALPIYRWAPQENVMAEIDAWRTENQAAGLTSVLFAYSLGKAQRVLAGVDQSLGPIYAPRAVIKINEAYRQTGVRLPEVVPISTRELPGPDALVVTPRSAEYSRWLSKVSYARGSASGWMQTRRAHHQRRDDAGFVLSDHADWPGLLAAVRACGPERVIATHGYEAPFVRYLREADGLDARHMSALALKHYRPPGRFPALGRGAI